MPRVGYTRDRPCARHEPRAICERGLMPVWTHRLLETLALFCCLFAIALATRPVARAAAAFGMHAVLCAPLFSCLATWYVQRRGAWWPVGVGSLLLASVLWAMSPVMGVGVGFPSVMATAVAGTLSLLVAAQRAEGGLDGRASRSIGRWLPIALGICLGALLYPATLFGAAALDYAAPWATGIGRITMLACCSAALAVAGSLLGSLLADGQETRS